MHLSDWNGILDQSEDYNSSIQEFTNNLMLLARHWRGQEGVDFIKSRVENNKSNGIPLAESLVEAYGYLRPKVI